MDTRDVLKKLESLVKLDVDAVRAYQQAIDEIDDSYIRQELSRFQSDHRAHIANLSQCIRNLGAEPPEARPDLKGFLIEGMTALRSKMGTESALKAMRANERLTNRTYDDALDLEMPADVRAVVSGNRDDERRHLEFIERCLEQRLWETGGTQPPAA